MHDDKTPAPPRSLWRGRLPAMVFALVLLGFVVAEIARNEQLRALIGAAWGRMTLAPVLAVLPVQLAAIGVCSVALWRLGPGVGLLACFESRILRDAGNNMLLILPGLGEAVGARAMVLAGGRPRVAVTVRALDILAETIGQLPYIAIALVLLTRVWGQISIPLPNVPGWFWAGLALVATALVLAGLARRRRHRRLRPRWMRHIAAEIHLLKREVRQRHGALPLAGLLHGIAWFLSCVQIWLAARAFGMPLGLWGGVAIESAASSMRVLMFFMPGGLAAQEAGIVGAGLAFGLPPSASLAIALVLRIRDLVFGAALAWWPVIEHRARARAA